ncbi:M56 family metallopeptidase [Emticicia sp. C21]|uniref:M56 family metallopeptidase n=1 Tax=Emticicia sp. C21 TaxID=2302915 RepID=UPI0013149E33|nr:M56 family metallopeptidase [Emticicia sp. C21]
MDFLFYLVQVNLYLILFYSFYRLVLFGETFHQLNRAYLIASALLSFGIPLWYSEYVQSWFITKEINEVFYTIYDPSMILVRPTKGVSFTWADILEGLYIIGISIFTIRLAITLLQLIIVLKNKDFGKFTAFSFFGYSFVDETLKKRDTILAHEHVHMQQLHSADVMIFEIIAILNWFNPVVYQYKKDIKHIHEFIADDIAAQNENSKAEYAMLLFTQEFGLHPDQLTNRFFTHSTLKRRIQMLSKPRSRRIMLLKYGLSVPLFMLMLVLSSATIVRNDVLDLVEVKLSGLTTDSVEIVPDNEAFVNNEMQKAAIERDNYSTEEVATAKNDKPLEATFVAVSNEDALATTKASKEYEIRAVEGDNMVFRLKSLEPAIITTSKQLPTTLSLAKVQPIRLQEKPTMGDEVVIAETKPAEKTPDIEEVFTSVEESPTFPGGVKELFKFIGRNLKYPVAAQRAKVSGKVFVKFVVRKDGSISDFNILKGIGFGCDEETIRVISQLPKWSPGRQNGRAVNVHFTMPVNFVLDEKGAKELQSVQVTSKEMPAKIGFQMKGFNDPLVLLDGKQIKKETFNNLDSDTVDSIHVLKDEAATRAYGDRGINGVVIIDTKKVLENQD